MKKRALVLECPSFLSKELGREGMPMWSGARKGCSASLVSLPVCGCDAWVATRSPVTTP
jgi:hypothetical protein